MSASGTIDFNLTITEVIPGGDGSDNANQIHRMSKFLTTAKSFGGATTPTWEQVWSDTVDLSGGAASLDLTALARQSPLADVDFTGLSVVAFGLAGAIANTNPITVAGSASNPYELFGGSTEQVDVEPGQIVLMADTTGANLAAVSGTVKAIDLSGTGTEQLHVLLIAGQ